MHDVVTVVVDFHASTAVFLRNGDRTAHAKRAHVKSMRALSAERAHAQSMRTCRLAKVCARAVIKSTNNNTFSAKPYLFCIIIDGPVAFEVAPISKMV